MRCCEPKSPGSHGSRDSLSPGASEIQRGEGYRDAQLPWGCTGLGEPQGLGWGAEGWPGGHEPRDVSCALA